MGVRCARCVGVGVGVRIGGQNNVSSDISSLNCDGVLCGCECRGRVLHNSAYSLERFHAIAWSINFSRKDSATTYVHVDKVDV